MYTYDKHALLLCVMNVHLMKLLSAVNSKRDEVLP
jgi:hypothetical protein